MREVIRPQLASILATVRIIFVVQFFFLQCSVQPGSIFFFFFFPLNFLVLFCRFKPTFDESNVSPKG